MCYHKKMETASVLWMFVNILWRKIECNRIYFYLFFFYKHLFIIVYRKSGYIEYARHKTSTTIGCLMDTQRCTYTKNESSWYRTFTLVPFFLDMPSEYECNYCNRSKMMSVCAVMLLIALILTLVNINK